MDPATKKRTITKKSVGIVLFSRDYKKVLLVQKRNTYAFNDFIAGKYVKTNKKHIQKLFNMMTVYEKSVLLSGDFEYIWYYAFLTYVKSDFYYKCYNKFNLFLRENARYFKSMLLGAGHAESTLWEPPKGRKNTDESNIACAMREIYEETAMGPDSYDFVFMETSKYKSIHIENNIRYNIIFYIARAKTPQENPPNINKLEQINEIVNIKWVPIKHLNKYSITPELKKFIVQTSGSLLGNNRSSGIANP